MKKFFLAAACVLTLTHCGCFSVLAKDNDGIETLEYGGINIVADGRKTAAAEELFIFNGVLYLPLEDIAKAVGKEVRWDKETATVYIGETPVQEEIGEIKKSENGNVIYDSGDIKVTYTGVSIDDFDDLSIDLLIENNSDKNYLVDVIDFSVNGYMASQYGSCEVVGGKKALSAITLDRSETAKFGISSPADLKGAEFVIEYYETDDYLYGEPVKSEIIKLNF